jgi:hypothetical protein
MKDIRFYLFIFSLCWYFPCKSIAQTRTIHILVALCDNENQGIVKVPEGIGNGQNPRTNLYWGCGYGVKTYFLKHNKNWQLIKTIQNPDSMIYERLVFKHKDSAVFIVADAYNGANIKETTIDLLNFAAGHKKQTLTLNQQTINFGGGADLIAYIGHDGLMDFSLDKYPQKADTKKREVVILACVSKFYFNDAIKQGGSYPLLWTSGLMCPEAYTVSAVVDAWVHNKTSQEIRLQAAQAYNKYQKCGINGAKNLLLTGW